MVVNKNTMRRMAIALIMSVDVSKMPDPTQSELTKDWPNGKKLGKGYTPRNKPFYRQKQRF